MTASCSPNTSASRKSLSAILRALATVGQKPAGEALGKSETWVSRWKSEDAKTCADLLAVLGLKVVPAENQCFPPEYVERLRYFAEIGIRQDAPTLNWEDE